MFTFTPTINDPNLKYSWNFGDGNTGNTAIATNTYKANGDYDVQLTITNARGCSETKTIKILVSSSKDIEYFTNVSLFPNPTADQTTLSIYSNKNIETTISIRDISGKLMETTKLPIQVGGNEITLATQNLNSGLYLIQISNSSGSETMKLQVIK
ncbi:MAG: T9SS type A sorting domain-containing protein [Saprospiraceae bacterium]|nr:T9SS type A sorting domain-containing protein [Saprospiraceae bacterium]